MSEYTPDGSGTVIFKICDSDGNVVKEYKKNLSEVAKLEDNNGNTKL